MSWEKSIFVGCSHGELVCQDAVAAVKRFMATWKPKHRVHLGDLWDFSALRRNAEPEERAMGISYDYNCGIEFLEWYKPQILTLGNHDHRIWRAAKESRNGPLADLLQSFCETAEDDLRKMRIHVTPWGVQNYAKLPVGGPKLLHGYRSTMYPAKAHFDSYGECILAHVHHPDSHEGRHIDGGKAYTIGTLANISKLSYADGYTAKLGWRNSFAYGMHNPKTGAWHLWHVVKRGKDWISPMGIV